MRTIKYHCDKCKKEIDINKENVIQKEIPVLEAIQVLGGKGHPAQVLSQFYQLAMKQVELCDRCSNAYEALKYHYFKQLAQHWANS
jgi:hypothetical protein